MVIDRKLQSMVNIIAETICHLGIRSLHYNVSGNLFIQAKLVTYLKMFQA